VSNRLNERILVEIVVFERGVGHFERKFQEEWGSPSNDVWHKKTRVPGLSHGVVCMILRLAVLTQFRRVSGTHTQTHDDGEYDKIRYIYVCSKADEIASLV